MRNTSQSFLRPALDGSAQAGEFSAEFGLFGATNLFFCVWAVYLAEAAVSKIFPSRGNALKNDMLKEESKKIEHARAEKRQK